MTQKNVAEVAALAAKVLNLPSDEVGAHASMETVPQWDSLAHLNICLAFQERFGITMNMETIAHSTSVAALAELLPA
jgi:acyl carrier protein